MERLWSGRRRATLLGPLSVAMVVALTANTGVVAQDASTPPLNGTGNDWKRTHAELAAVIKNGVRRKSDKTDVMPAWKGRLGDRDIEDVVNWMQSLWPEQVYDAWNKAQAAAAPKS